MFSLTFISKHKPSLRRSLGMNAIPFDQASFGDLAKEFSRTVASPDNAFPTPTKSLSKLLWPEPAKPVTPNTSPAFRSKLIPVSSFVSIFRKETVFFEAMLAVRGG